MKKLTFLIVLFLFSLSLNSQITKGTKMLGIRVNFNQNKSDMTNEPNFSGVTSSTNKLTNFNTALNFGHFVANNVVIGLIAGYANTNQEMTQSGGRSIFQESYSSNERTDVVYAGIYSRYYKMFYDNRVGFFGHFQALYEVGTSLNKQTRLYDNTPYYYPDENGDIQGFSIGLSPGVVYFITKSIGLEVSFGNLGYTTRTETVEAEDQELGTYKNSGFNFSFSAATFNIGVNFYLSGKKNKTL